MEITMFHDVSKCTGCRACTVACKQWKSLPADLTPFVGEFQSHPDLSPTTYTMIRMSERIEGDKFHWDFLKFQCMHCSDAACVKVCPQDALYYSDNGTISLNVGMCMGCGKCVTACPFGVPHINEKTHKSTKCNFCEDRILKGMEPACSKTCPSDAIYFGRRDKMIAMAEARVKELKKTNPRVQIYGNDKQGVGGIHHMIYVLEDAPEVYRLLGLLGDLADLGDAFEDKDFAVQDSLGHLKDLMSPLGGLAVGGTLAAAVFGFIIYRKSAEKRLNSDMPIDIATEDKATFNKNGGDV